MGSAPGKGVAVKKFLAWLAGTFLAVWSAPAATAAPATNGASVILILGAAGESEFGSNFLRQAQLWEETSRRAGASFMRLGEETTNAMADRELLQQQLAAEPADGLTPLWLVWIGHGTFDGQEARFNLRGPDISATEVAAWLKPFRRPLVIINTASASAPFLSKLSATNRVVITATRSGSELNYTRFGQYLAQAITEPRSDLDQDGQTSLLEAFLSASARVAEFYKAEGRLATEHALLDDNGDGLGTPADWFRGVRAIKKPQQGALDGVRAHQLHLLPSPAEQLLPAEVRARRDTLELELAALRETKATLTEEQYYLRLETILLQLARLLVPHQPQ
jgi:hypothetical protein